MKIVWRIVKRAGEQPDGGIKEVIGPIIFVQKYIAVRGRLQARAIIKALCGDTSHHHVCWVS